MNFRSNTEKGCGHVVQTTHCTAHGHKPRQDHSSRTPSCLPISHHPESILRRDTVKEKEVRRINLVSYHPIIIPRSPRSLSPGGGTQPPPVRVVWHELGFNKRQVEVYVEGLPHMENTREVVGTIKQINKTTELPRACLKLPLLNPPMFGMANNSF